MKKYLILFFALLSVSAGQARESYNINRNWRFFSYEDDRERRVNLPHTWNSDALGGEKDYYRGPGNYQNEVFIPAELQGHRFFLRGYGANSVASLLVNSKYVGEHKGGYTAFTFEITDYLLYGETNYLWLMVNNAPRTDVLPIAGDANSYGGLFRDVELIVTGPEVISLTDDSSDGVQVVQKKVDAQRVEAQAVVRVDGLRDNNDLLARVRVSDAGGAVVAGAEQKFKLSGKAATTVTVPFSVDKPMLWNGVKNPYMYDVTVVIESGGEAVDSVRVATGFRTVGLDDDGNFLLNGDPYPLRGVVVHQDRAMYGTAITTYQVEEDFDFICEMGANIVRVAGVLHHPHFYELCDRAGILVWSDFPLVGPARRTDRSFINSADFTDGALRQSAEIVAGQFDHPSVVMWGLFSDLRFGGEDPSDFIGRLNEATKKQDPSRLTAASSNDDGQANMVPDVIVWDHHFGWKEGLPSDIALWQTQMHGEFKSLRSGVSYGAGASIFHQEDSLKRPDYMGNWHPERWQTYLHEEYYKYLAPDSHFLGIFVANLFDYGAALRTWGEDKGINDLGLVTFDRKYRKDAFYFYKANWNPEDPFVYIAERRWDRRSQKQQQIRVYTNRPEVELFVNGESKGVAQPVNGTIVWDGVELLDGDNRIEVTHGGLHDSAVIRVVGSGSAYSIQ